MIKCVIFDLDGTILDTVATITHYVNHTLRKIGVEPITVDQCKYLAGKGARSLIKNTLSLKGVRISEDDFEDLLTYYLNAYDSDPLYLTSPFDGIIDLLKSLKSNGIRTAVVSNKPNDATVAVVRHFFGNLVDYVAGQREGVPTKPDPTSSLIALSAVSADPDSTAFVGDTSVDMLTGKNLGVQLIVGVLWGFRDKEELLSSGATFIASSPNDILAEVVKK